MYSIKFLRWILPALVLTFLAAIAPAQISITVTTAPPPLPVYEQPPCPEEGSMWVPGYWAWGDDGYYWVPGEWVPAPYAGALWTPPWWGWDNGRYRFHEGYWGNDVGYYGGIDYGYGYMGEGFSGGEWRDGRFAYNTAVMRVNPTVIHNTYVNETIVRRETIPNDRHIAYNGGPNGIRHDPSPIERRGMTGRHTSLTPVQQRQIQAARGDRSSYAKANGGRPERVVVARPEGPLRNGGSVGHPGSRQPERQIAPAPTRGETRSEPSRTSPGYRNQPNRNQANPRTQSRPSPPDKRPYTESRPESRAIPEPRNGSRPAQPTDRPRTEPRTNNRDERPRTESRPAPQTERPRPESRPAPAPRESRPAPSPRPEPQRESRPAPTQRPQPQHESRPAPEPHAEVRSESRPAPQHDSRGGQGHAEQHSASPRESRPQSPRQEKPRPE